MSIWGKLLGGIAGAGLSIALPGIGSALAPIAGSLVGGLFDSSNSNNNQQQNQNTNNTNTESGGGTAIGDNLVNLGMNTAMGIMPDILNNIFNKPKPVNQVNMLGQVNTNSFDPEKYFMQKNIGNSFDIGNYFRKEQNGMFGNYNEKGLMGNTDIGGGIYTDILRRYNNGTY